MSKTSANQPVLELRVAITTADYERLLGFYLDGLGVEPAAVWNNDGGRATMLDLGAGTLELFDQRQAEVVDDIEVGERVSGAVRLALRVPDLDAAMARLVARGARRVGGPVTTPWGDRNARVEDPDGMQVTLYQAAPES